ncbi:MAG: GNAT family N-acetyltransferase [Solirubrobacteraceae bacterium]
MSFVLTRDASEFRDRAWAFLERRPECNVLATVLLSVLDGGFDDVGPLFAYALDGAGSVTAAALRTPPFAMLASELAPGAAEELLEAWLADDPALPGANANPATARALADGWRARTGGITRRTRSMAMHALERVVDPPRPPAGSLRLGQRSERQLLIEWWRAFAEEAGSVGGARAAANVEARLDQNGLFVWDDDGPASVVAISPSVAGVVRIGPVYTPLRRRRHGYAGMAVAEVSRRALAHGARSCMLFTDLDNPTSNKIYSEVGYRRFGDWEEHAFQLDRE